MILLNQIEKLACREVDNMQRVMECSILRQVQNKGLVFINYLELYPRLYIRGLSEKVKHNSEFYICIYIYLYNKKFRHRFNFCFKTICLVFSYILFLYYIKFYIIYILCDVCLTLFWNYYLYSARFGTAPPISGIRRRSRSAREHVPATCLNK